jgi:hypothetical protein
MAQFLSSNNLNVIFETVTDNGMKINLASLKENATKFIERERSKNYSLYELNTTFIMELYSASKQRTVQAPAPIQAPAPAPIPLPEIISSMEEIRSSEFDERLKNKQHEYDNSILRIKPPVPIFKREEQDKPISEMDELIRKTLAQRNFEIDQIYQKVDAPPKQPPTTEKHISWKDENTQDIKFDFSKLKQAPSIESQLELILKEVRGIKEKLNMM